MARLFKTKSEERSLWQRIRDVAVTDVGVLMRGLDEGSLERLEELLLGADFGVRATLRLVDRMEDLTRRAEIRSEEDLHDAVEAEIRGILAGEDLDYTLSENPDGPTIYMVVGVNGVGKTTTIGKLAHRLMERGRRVLLAAGDTFRAGAIEQLREWCERTGAGFVGAQSGADPASVAFDAMDAAHSRNADAVIIDTAGRLHTQRDLMGELDKIQRVVGRKVPGAPHETLHVLDATVGQNAVMQVRTFGNAIELTGLAVAKLDSSARGGIVVALTDEFGVPVKLVGTGEGIEDLEPFDPETFARDVLDA